MNKKASLKDAFVKNTEGAGNQQTRDTAIQTAGFPGSQLAGFTAIQTPSYPSMPIKKKATFNLDAALHQRLKIAAAIHSREMVDIVQDALQAYLPVLDRKAG